MKAIGNKVIVLKPKIGERKLDSGIIAVSGYEEQHGETCIAQVVSAGPDTKQVKDGMNVLTQYGCGVNFFVGGVEFHIMKEEDILAIEE